MSVNARSTVLVFNPGSASLKFEIFVSEPLRPSNVRGTKVLSGVVEPIGPNAKFSLLDGRKKTAEEDLPVKDHGDAAGRKGSGSSRSCKHAGHPGHGTSRGSRRRSLLGAGSLPGVANSGPRESGPA